MGGVIEWTIWCMCVNVLAELDELYPINLLTEEMQNDDTEIRIKSMRRLKIVAQALGPEKTRTELLPFLNGMGWFFSFDVKWFYDKHRRWILWAEATQDEDEVLVALAEALGDFVNLIGGARFAPKLLEPLEVLAATEETVVRDQVQERCLKVQFYVYNWKMDSLLGRSIHQ